MSLDLSSLKHRVSDQAAPQVYYTPSISPAALRTVYEALGRVPAGQVAVKLSTGEAGNPNYLQPALIKDLVQSFADTIVEGNTAYQGARHETAVHRQLIHEHGFDAIAQVDILDEEGSIDLPVVGGTHLKFDRVGSHLTNYDFLVVLSHFKGHPRGGFGGALKNISIGIAAPEGKNLIHTAGTTNTSQWGPYLSRDFDSPEHLAFIESMAEAAQAICAHFGHKMLYISVLNHLSVDCDCVSHPAPATMADLGIAASLDPVALDQACVDLIYAAPDGADVIERMESRHGSRILEHAERLGVGQRHYQLTVLD